MNVRLVAVALLFLTTAAPLAADIVSVPTPSIIAQSVQTVSGGGLSVPGYTLTTSPGDPALPSREVRIILPPDADPDSVSVSLSGAKATLLTGKRDLQPSPPLAVSTPRGEIHDWGLHKQIVDGRNALIYRRNAFYPNDHLELVQVGNLRRWRIATVRYYPYRYNPVTGRLRLAAGGEIAVSYSRGVSADSPDVADDSTALDDLAAQAANFAQAQEWYGPSVQAANGYAIITTSAIVQGSTKLQTFVNHKTNRGFSVYLVTEGQWGGGTGDAAANNVRVWLKNNYITKSLRYALLIGDSHPTSGTVPMKMLWPRYESTTYREAPSDYFYADLTGNWDRNANGYFGDMGDFGSGGIDLNPEVIVGRIPFYGVFSELDSILRKIIDYESGGIGGPWVRNTLVTMKPSDANTPGYHLGEAIKSDAADPAGFTTTRVYEQTHGLNPPPDYTPCTYETTLAAVRQHAGFWFWWTHGNETVADQITSTTRTANLDDRYPSFTFQCSCLNAYPERADNLAYALLKRGAIATNAATRVSWYYQGQTEYANTDSNAGMTYRYAIKLVRDHMACGDAHYAMLLEIPQQIWMNHVVFNIHGDPSVAYAAGPLISHTPLQDTDDHAHPYTVTADITSNGPLAADNPVVKWSTDGGATYSTSVMSPAGGIAYLGQIPPQPLGTTVHYYITAQDSQGRTGSSPTTAPTSVHSFNIRPDMQPPAISHTPLTDTGLTSGPYDVQATVTDDCGVKSVVLRYNVNGGADTEVPMTTTGGGVYTAPILGPTQQGDRISYYILATDTSFAGKTARSPATGYHTFGIRTSRVAVYNSAAIPPYFVGSNSNIYSSVFDAVATDPKQRFTVSVLTSLTPADLADKDSLILPDNGVAPADLGSVANWFAPGKVLVAIDSSANYAAYSGFLWPDAAGSNGNRVYWDQNAAVDDQKIVLQDPVTIGYTVGQIIKSRGYGAQFYISELPPDAKVLAISNNNPSQAYAVYRDVPGAGRFVALGPYRPLEPDHYSMLREALAAPSVLPRSVQITYPSGGESIDLGESVEMRFAPSGSWSSSDRIKLEYTTGLDPDWLEIPGASSLPYNAGTFTWNTAGLPASVGYRVKATLVGGTVSGESNPFALAPAASIASAKSIADGRLVKLAGAVVVSASADATYVEEMNRSAGIRVITAQPMSLGDVVTLTGTLTTVNGERALSIQMVEVHIGAAAKVEPIAMSNATLGGGRSGYQQAVTEYRREQAVQAGGANNIGILVTTTGKVTATGSDFYYIDDGAACDDGSGFTGVRVIRGDAPKPEVGALLVVTGVSSTYFDRGTIWRAIVLPDAGYSRVLAL